MNAIAHGRATVDNYLPGADCLSTLDCLRVIDRFLRPAAGSQI